MRKKEKERASRLGSSIRQLDVPCQISEKVVAFCPAGGTASRNTLQSCKGRWDLRDILHRLPAPRNSSSYIGRFPVADQCDVPRGDVSLPTCSAVPWIRSGEKIGSRKFPWSTEDNLMLFLVHHHNCGSLKLLFPFH